MAWLTRTSPQVVFAGGAYGTSIDTSYSRFVSGHYILSDESVPLVANQTLDRERYGILAGSSLTVPCAENLTHLLNGAGGDAEETGGAFTMGYDFTATELTLVDPPEWVVAIGKDESDNIVLEVKSRGTMIIVR